VKPLQAIVERADSIMFDESNTLEDWRDALELYKTAGSMGSGLAFSRIACMYYFGNGLKKDYNRTIEYFKKAVSLKSYEDFYVMTAAYIKLSENQNALKSFYYFLDNYNSIEIESLISDKGEYLALMFDSFLIHKIKIEERYVIKSLPMLTEYYKFEFEYFDELSDPDAEDTEKRDIVREQWGRFHEFCNKVLDG
jgi:TPR repeat protein